MNVYLCTEVHIHNSFRTLARSRYLHQYEDFRARWAYAHGDVRPAVGDMGQMRIITKGFPWRPTSSWSTLALRPMVADGNWPPEAMITRDITPKPEHQRPCRIGCYKLHPNGKYNNNTLLNIVVIFIITSDSDNSPDYYMYSFKKQNILSILEIKNFIIKKNNVIKRIKAFVKMKKNYNFSFAKKYIKFRGQYKILYL